MAIIYLKNPEDGRIMQGEKDSFGAFFENWEALSEEEASIHLLKSARDGKLRELANVYSNNSTWECTLKAVDGTLTRDKNWLRDNITLTSRFKDDKGVPFVKNFTAEQILKIRDDLQGWGSLILDKKEAIESKINSAKKIADIEKIDIEKEFAQINRVIEIA